VQLVCCGFSKPKLKLCKLCSGIIFRVHLQFVHINIEVQSALLKPNPSTPRLWGSPQGGFGLKNGIHSYGFKVNLTLAIAVRLKVKFGLTSAHCISSTAIVSCSTLTLQVRIRPARSGLHCCQMVSNTMHWVLNSETKLKGNFPKLRLTPWVVVFPLHL
jgi:hypothetical protein